MIYQVVVAHNFSASIIIQLYMIELLHLKGNIESLILEYNHHQMVGKNDVQIVNQ